MKTVWTNVRSVVVLNRIEGFIFSAEALHKLAKNIASYFMEEMKTIKRLIPLESFLYQQSPHLHTSVNPLPCLLSHWERQMVCAPIKVKPSPCHLSLPPPCRCSSNDFLLSHYFAIRKTNKQKAAIFSVKVKTKIKKPWLASPPEFSAPFPWCSSLQNFLDDLSCAPCLQFFSFLKSMAVMLPPPVY